MGIFSKLLAQSSESVTVASVKGGMFAWQRSGGKVVATSGRDGMVV